ncbi:alpha-1,2-Mannosidase [Paramyrothecium foliicola]|nr:alpha-1,2-Mannosidase [Paramyrothecium foliicola]
MALRLSRRTPRLAVLTGAILFILLVLHLRRLPSSPSAASSPVRAQSQSASGAFVPSSVDWSKAKQYHPPGPIKPLPSGPAQRLPRVQADSSAFEHSATTDKRRAAVRDAFERSYNAYRKHAWLRDELTPVTGRGKDPFGGWAATAVDALDTLWIMDFKSEFREAVAAVGHLDWAKTDAGAINLFETTIRHLGGILSAYDLSGDSVLLKKAIELGDMLYAGFDTPNRLPGFWLNFVQSQQGRLQAGTSDPSASPASLCLEFTRLSQITGDPKYYDATDRITRFLERVQNDTRMPGMWPTAINFRAESVPDSSFTLGALADSLYEYLPKMYALLGGVDDTYEKMYRGAADTAIKNMLFRPMVPRGKDGYPDILFTGDVHVGGDGPTLNPETQHLTCFVGGMFGLGGKLFGLEEHVGLGERLARGCGWAYSSTPTGVMPEILQLIACKSIKEPCTWDENLWEEQIASNKKKTDPVKGFKQARDARYLLRPEAIESIFLLYRMTGKADLQDLAWDMFQSIIKSTRTDLAYSAISDVTATGETHKLDSMESFWLAETLKYFYLIFSPPDVISLDEYVLNTEAHPFKRPQKGGKDLK